MKILAIRGANLTSLAGDFAVDFERPPLDHAGIFAITGPTGSGKTTFLDAMCLALFDRTPRFRERGGVGIGRSDLTEGERLLSNDVRNLRRTGSAAGHAEVVFVGRDGHRWIARWEVRRARGRADGRLQEQTLTLTDAATAQPVGRTKKEVLHAIEERLGLSFDQFCRSVLLAQGEFAAFLLAKEHERAELLERMTGTQIYAEVSRRCHERASHERARLAELRERHSGVAVLSPDERVAHEQDVARLAGAVADGRRHLVRVAAAIAWHSTLTEFAASLASAEAELRRAQAAESELLPLADEVAAVERAQTFRDVVRRHDELQATGIERDTRLAAASEAARLAVQTREQATASLEGAKEALVTAGAARAEAEPALLRARLLDAELARRAEELAIARTEAEEAASVAARERAARATLDDVAGAARLERDELARWLLENEALLALADGWPRWEEAFDRARSAIEEITTAEPQLSRLAGERETAAAALAAIEAGLKTLETERERATAELREAASRAEAHPQSTAQQVETAALGRLATLRSAVERAARIVEARVREQAAEERETLAGSRASEAEQAEGAARKTAEELAPKIAATAEHLDEARGFASLHEYRVKLRRGRPCPLCGSIEHPIKQGSLPFPSTVDDLIQELQALRQLAIEAATAQAEARERARASRHEAEEAARERRESAVARISEEERFRADRSLLGDETLPGSPVAEGAMEELRTQVATVEASVAPLREATRRAEELEERAERLRTELDAMHAKIERTRLSRDEATAGPGQTERLLIRLRAESDAARRRRDEALESLTSAFPPGSDWRDELLRTPALFVARTRDECEAFLARRRQLDQVGGRLVALEHEANAAEHAYRACAAVAAEKAEASGALGETVGALSAERATLLDGKPPDSAQSALDAAVGDAESRRQEAEAALRQACAAAAEVEGRRDEARAALDEARTARRGAEEELHSALVGLGIVEDGLRALLNRDAGWVEAHRSDLDQACQAVRDWRTRLDERTRALRQHEARDRSDLGGEAALAARAAAEAGLHESEALLTARKGLLVVDDDRRRQAAELLEQGERQRSVVDLWDRLDELIGSADGKKLRVFAQSLTLESLLDLANEHLRELAPRYRLERIPAADLEVQLVDREMGDEARGANSLSGGETFLVSLALALGLSSLASRDTRIESLFIDEGFGSLDTRSLDQAISVLDSLQASGSKVGLISHVSGLAERIGVQVRLSRCGGGRSVLEVLGTG